jgi:hypothetical protein
MLSILDFRLSFGTSFFLKPSLFDNHEIKTDYFYLLVFVGFCGGIVGTPADMINVRMQNDMKLPVDQRRNYKHIFDGIRRVASEEGILVLWSGVSMNVVRSVLMTVGQLAFYDQAKQALMGSGYFVDNLVTHFCSSVIAVCCLCLF